MPQHVASKCPTCGTAVDASSLAFTDSESVVMPRPGDVTVCLYCAGVSVYDDALHLRVPSAEERREAEQLEDVRRAVAAIRRHIRRRN